MKIYDEKLKYKSGRDHFDQKIIIFYDLYKKARVSSSDFTSAFSIIFTGKARDFYYLRIANKNLIFEQLVAVIRNNFETKERR